MSLSDTVSQAAATNPTVGVAVASEETKSALLAGLQTGDAPFGAALAAQSAEALQVSTLRAGVEPGLGQNVDLRG